MMQPVVLPSTTTTLLSEPAGAPASPASPVDAADAADAASAAAAAAAAAASAASAPAASASAASAAATHLSSPAAVLSPVTAALRNTPYLNVDPAQLEPRTVVIVFGRGQENIVQVVADVLGKPWTTEASLNSLSRGSNAVVVGVPAAELASHLARCTDRTSASTSASNSASASGCDRSSILLINTHCVDDGSAPDERLTDSCDYEFLYCRSPFFRRDLTRFLSLILGQRRPHEDLKTKRRTNFISTTFPDVHAALSNLDILSVGSDAVEIRVDLLVDPSPAGDSAAAVAAGATADSAAVPSLRYVGQQVMILRQHTELPLIFTTRCTRENGKFPMDDPSLFYRYLRRAIKWGVEYIDVELWLPEEIRRRLAEDKGNSVIMSAFHDFSGTWKWTSPRAHEIFLESTKYADIVKMIAMVNTIEENYELEYFRSTIKANYPHHLLSAVNMGQMGQLSRALNTVFSPITHPLLPMIAAPGQLTAAEINEALHIMGSLPKRDMYAIGSFRATPQSMFMEKCFNELSLPHHFSSIDRGPKGSIESVIMQPSFGGAYVNPPIASSTSYIPTVSDAARAIGLVDTITVSAKTDISITTTATTIPSNSNSSSNNNNNNNNNNNSSSSSSSSNSNINNNNININNGNNTNGEEHQTFVGENAAWKGIRATLTRDYVPSAYWGRAAIILSSSESDASAAIFALRSLRVGPIYTVGFKATGPLASGLEQFTSIQSVKLVEQPFVIVSALPPEKSLLVQPLLRHYKANGRASPPSTRGKVYLDLTSGRRKGDPVAVAVSAGWTAYGIEDVNAWTTVETLRLLVGQNVPFDFVRMASGRALF